MCTLVERPDEEEEGSGQYFFERWLSISQTRLREMLELRFPPQRHTYLALYTLAHNAIYRCVE